MTALRCIETVQVTESIKCHGTRYYTINVYRILSRCHIPTCQSTAIGEDRNPSFQVQQTLTAFSDMRDRIFDCAYSGHGDIVCTFCANILTSLQFDTAQPHRLRSCFRNEKDVSNELTLFLNRMLEITKRLRTFACQDCRGQQEIPQLLKQFLSTDEADTLTAQHA